MYKNRKNFFQYNLALKVFMPENLGELNNISQKVMNCNNFLSYKNL